MISELVTFNLPAGTHREEVVRDMHLVAPKWRANPDLIRKTFIYDAEASMSGALYTWKNLAAAQRAHGTEWRESIRSRYGSEPTVRYFDTPLIVDNALDTLVEGESAASPV